VLMQNVRQANSRRSSLDSYYCICCAGIGIDMRQVIHRQMGCRKRDWGLRYGWVGDEIWLAYSSFSEFYELRGDTLVFSQQAQQQVLGADDQLLVTDVLATLGVGDTVWGSLPIVTMSCPARESCSSYIPSPLDHRLEHGVEAAVHDLVDWSVRR
jgi:hypothetical protein